MEDVTTIISAIDGFLSDFRFRGIVTARESQDMLLDLRLQCARIVEQGDKNGKLQERAPTVVGATSGSG